MVLLFLSITGALVSMATGGSGSSSWLRSVDVCLGSEARELHQHAACEEEAGDPRVPLERSLRHEILRAVGT